MQKSSALTAICFIQGFCLMPHSITKANLYNRPICPLISAVLLLSMTIVVPASASSPDILPATAVKNDPSICAELQTPSHHLKNKNARQRSISCMQAQLQTYQQKSMSVRQQYFAYKAQAWLSYAIHKNSMNSRSGAGLQAEKMAEDILTVLNKGAEQDLPLIQDIPSNSTLMRPDLWATITALKESDGLASAPREIAFSEVSLIWAATDHCERGGRETGSQFRMADRWLEQAREAYVNAHDSQTNVALQELILSYYKKYVLLGASDEVCLGQALTPS